MQGESHLLQSVPTLVYPAGHDETQVPSKNKPLEHVQTLLTGLVPPGHDLTQSLFDK